MITVVSYTFTCSVPGADPYDVLTASSLSLAWTLDALSVQQRALTTVNVFLNTRNETDFGALVQWVEFLFFNRTAFAVRFIDLFHLACCCDHYSIY